MKVSNQKPIRILMCVNIMDRAGAEMMIMNYYRKINKNNIQFDFLTHRSKKGTFDNEIRSMGGKIYYAPRLYPHNYFKYIKYMNNFFKKHNEYKIIHCHMDAMSFFPLFMAKINHIPFRIAHSHTSKLDFDFKLPIKFISKFNVKKVSNINFACSNKAGHFLFGKKKFELLSNAIDLDKFKFNSKIRNDIRKKNNIPIDAIVIGHVGRLNYIKNQMFLLDTLKKLNDDNCKSYLVLVGDGPDLNKIKSRIEKLNLKSNVRILRNRDDVNDLLQMMDIFVMPSLFEGLPVSGIEAQANGLPTLFSKNISEEILLCKNAYSFNINDGPNECANLIKKCSLERNKDAINTLIEKGYDINKESKKLEDYYIKLYDMLNKEE